MKIEHALDTRECYVPTVGKSVLDKQQWEKTQYAPAAVSVITCMNHCVSGRQKKDPVCPCCSLCNDMYESLCDGRPEKDPVCPRFNLCNDVYELLCDGRQISEEQMATFSGRFLSYSLPLYVKLIAEEARALHSFTDSSRLKLPADCAEGIEKLFDRSAPVSPTRGLGILLCFKA